MQYQRIQAITLLCSILFQSCSDLGLKMADEEGLEDTTSDLHPRSETKTQERSKMPTEQASKLSVLPRVKTLATPKEAQQVVSAYLARWSLEPPSGRAAIQEQGHTILKDVERLKKATKRS